MGLGGSKQSMHLAISQGFIALLFILVDYVFSKQLSVAQFGVFKEIFFVLNLGIPLIAFGLPEGFKYFIAKEENLNSYFRNVTGILFNISASIFIIILIINGLHYLKIVDIQYFYLSSLLFPLPILAFLLHKILRYAYINKDDAQRLTRLSLYGAIFSLGVVIAGYLFLEAFNNEIALVAVLMYFAIFFSPMVFYLRDFKESSFSLKFDIQIALKFFKYGFPLYLATFAGILNVYLDKSIVAIMENESVFAIFSVGAIEIPIFAMLSAAFSQQIYPQMVVSINKGETFKARQLWLQTTKKVSLLTYPVILVCMIFAEEIIFFVYSTSYQESVFLFRTYLLITLFRNNSYGILLSSKGETKMIAKIAFVMLLLNVSFSITAFFLFGLIGIVYGSLFSTLFFVITILLKENLMTSYIKKVLLSPMVFLLTVAILFVYFFFG